MGTPTWKPPSRCSRSRWPSLPAALLVPWAMHLARWRCSSRPSAHGPIWENGEAQVLEMMMNLWFQIFWGFHVEFKGCTMVHKVKWGNVWFSYTVIWSQLLFKNCTWRANLNVLRSSAFLALLYIANAMHSEFDKSWYDHYSRYIHFKNYCHVPAQNLLQYLQKSINSSCR